MSGYTVTEIVVWLLLATALGFALGWIARELLLRTKPGTASSPDVEPPAQPQPVTTLAVEEPQEKKAPETKTAVKAPAKKTAAKKPAAKKTAAKKPAAKKTTAKKTAAKKSPAKKTAPPEKPDNT